MVENTAHFSDQLVTEQGENGVVTGLNLVQVFNLLGEISSRWKEAGRLDGLLFRALCRLSARNREQAEQGFTSLDIATAIGEMRNRQWSSPDDKETMSDDVRRQWKRLLELWDSKQEGVSQYLQQQGWQVVPRLIKVEGGGAGNPSRYRITLLAGDADERPVRLGAVQPAGAPAEEVQYICEDIKDASLVARVFAKGYDLHGWRRVIYVASLLLPLLFAFFLLMLLVISIGFGASLGKRELTFALTTAALFFVVMRTIGPLLALPDRRIVCAPWWMQSVEDDRLLEIRLPPRYDRRSVKATRYTSTCPVCGSTLVAKSGRFEFYGRIVGRCEEAPAEHVFSFDHVTRVGKVLRSPGV